MFYRYSADRKGERPRGHLERFSGYLHADAFAGYEALYRADGPKPPRITHVARMAHARVDVEAQTNLVATAQEVILKRAFDKMPDRMKEVVAALSLADVPLSRDEASAYLEKACKLTRQSAISLLRQLPDSGAVELFSNSGIKVHDAMRLLGRAYIAGRGADHERDNRKLLSATIIESIQKDWSIAKVALLVRLFGQLGQAKILVEFAADELFHEMGVWREIEPFLIAIAEDADEDAETRLWALDGLVFNDLREGNIERGLERIDAMRALLDNNKLGSDEWLAWATKRMLAVPATTMSRALWACLPRSRSAFRKATSTIASSATIELWRCSSSGPTTSPSRKQSGSGKSITTSWVYRQSRSLAETRRPSGRCCPRGGTTEMT